MAEIDAETLRRERRNFFFATQGGVYFPVAGSIFWLGLGGAGFYLSERAWCVAVLSAGILAIPIGTLLFKKLVSHLLLKSPLASLILPALLPVALSLGMALAAFRSNMSLVPLALVIGLASHWPAVGWLFETRLFALHSIVRVALAVTLWFLLPDGRFTWLPMSIGLLYAATAAWIFYDLRRLRPRRG